MCNPPSRLGNHGEHKGFNKAKFMTTFSVNGKDKRLFDYFSYEKRIPPKRKDHTIC